MTAESVETVTSATECKLEVATPVVEQQPQQITAPTPSSALQLAQSLPLNPTVVSTGSLTAAATPTSAEPVPVAPATNQTASDPTEAPATTTTTDALLAAESITKIEAQTETATETKPVTETEVTDIIPTTLISNPAYTDETMTIKQDPVSEAEPKLQIDDCRDNGIFNFMTPERAIELYKRIHTTGVPDLEWKFYGRRRLDAGQESGKNDNSCDTTDGTQLEQQGDQAQESLVQTEFDFDESYAELATDTSTIINDSLQLKNRPEPGSEKKTNLSDIMNHLMKEKSITEEE